MTPIHKAIEELIILHAPPGVKPVNYLMALLDIGLDSAYRRLKGSIPFSFYELTKLSLHLGFSIDQLVGKQGSSKVFFEIPGDVSTHPQESYIWMLTYITRLLRKQYYQGASELVFVVNRLLIFHVLGLGALSKFFYYKWVHQMGASPVSFAGLAFPEEIRTLCLKAFAYRSGVGKNSYIVDRRVVANTMNDLAYYYKRSLITDDDFAEIKADIRTLLDYVEKTAQTGVNHLGSEVNIYLSALSIGTNSVYAGINGSVESHFWVYSAFPLSTNDPDLCSMHLKWIHALRRHCVLITQSNEMLQAEFFRQQRQLIE